MVLVVHSIRCTVDGCVKIKKNSSGECEWAYLGGLCKNGNGSKTAETGILAYRTCRVVFYGMHKIIMQACRSIKIPRMAE